MNINEIDDIIQLKALAYDQLNAIEIARANLSLIQQRIADLSKGSEMTT